MQLVAPSTWTKLADHELEIYQSSSATIETQVVNGQIETSPAGVKVELRPIGGTYTFGWRAPIAGWYRFGYRDDRYETTTRIQLDQNMVVLSDVRPLATLDGGTAYASPEISTSSGQRLMTGNWEHSLKTEWHSD